MKALKESIYLAICVIVFVTLMTMNAFAHSGRTDSSGGHKDNKNKSGLGSYHYHCGGYPAHLHDGGYCPYTDVAPSSVSVSISNSSLHIGETTIVSATVSPTNAYDTSVYWTSSDENVVKVSYGNVEAVGYGQATITATAINGISNSVTINVIEVVPESVAISGGNDTLEVGDTCVFSASISPDNANNKAISWSSDNPAVANVDATGKLTAVSAGTATIKATACNGVVASKTVTINEVVVTESIENVCTETYETEVDGEALIPVGNDEIAESDISQDTEDTNEIDEGEEDASPIPGLAILAGGCYIVWRKVKGKKKREVQ